MFTGNFTTTGIEFAEILAISDAGAQIEDTMLSLESQYDALLVSYDIQYAAFERGEWYADIALLNVIDQLTEIEREIAIQDEWLAVMQAEFHALDATLQYAA